MNQILLTATTAAHEAGNIIHSFYHSEYEVKMKGKGNPVTEADIAADNKLKEILTTGFPEYGWLSEETRDTSDRLTKKRVWIVDPIDGTKEFVKRNGEFTINIALVHKKTPVLGVVYSPVLNLCYWAKSNEGAFKDGKKLPLKTKRQRDVYKIVASRSHMSSETKDFIEAIDTDKEKEIISIGSSLKICLVAEGEANIYPRLGPTMEWDTAAAHAIVNESDGLFNRYIDNSAHLYNKKNLLNDWFVVTSSR